ncbi:MAG: oligosaccharide flippase family protein [Oscillospiraceae bacterium]|nr:oligosaccharide flippase family protein [Oscillospiraceae bacterium]
MSKRSMITGALILSASALFVRMIGFVFRIYLSGAIGAEGMGVHTLIMSMYNVCVTLATSGMAGAVSTLCAEQLSLGRPANARRILRRACGLALAISLTVCAAVLIFAQPIGAGMLRDARTVMPLRILAVGLPFLSLAACLRGYFISARRVGNPAVSQVLEQLIKMGFIMLLIGWAVPYGIETACAVVMGGMTLGEIACCVYSFAGYLRASKKRTQQEKADITGVYHKILKITVPLSVTSYARSFLHLWEDVLILAGLKAFSGLAGVATGTYGMLKGMVMPMLIFPLMLLSSFVITLTPEISRMRATGNTARLEWAVNMILHYTCVAGVLIVAIFLTFPFEIGAAVYKSAEVGEMLKRLAFLSPFMCIEIVTVGILSGLEEQASTMRYALLDSFVRISLIILLVGRMGVDGFMIVVIVSNMLTSVLNFRRLMRITGIKPNLNEWFLKPVLAAAATCQIARAAHNYLPMEALPTVWSLLAGIALICASYTATLFSIGSVKLKDFSWLINRIKVSGKIPDKVVET